MSLSKIYKSYNVRNRITLYTGDCIDFINTLPENSVQLVVTSPPYNIGKEYEGKLKLDSYLDWQYEIIKKCKYILKPNGSICWQTGNYINSSGKSKKEILPLDILLHPIFHEFDFKMRNRIVWKFGHGLHGTHRLSGRYEVISWYTISDEYLFNLDPIRVMQKYRGKRAYRGIKKGLPSGNPLGKNPSDYWEDVDFSEEELEYLQDVWTQIPNVKGNHVEKSLHPCQFPIALVRRLIKMLTNKNHLVFDPFVGTGTTLAAAKLEGRRSAGSEIDRKYVKIAESKLIKLLNGNLRYREDVPIHRPRGTEKVVCEPEEWRG